MHAPIVRTVRRLLAFAAVAVATTTAGAAPLPLLRITDISASTGLAGSQSADINNRGEVLAYRPDGSAFVWKAGSAPQTFQPPPGYKLDPRKLNDEGVVVGSVYQPNKPYDSFPPFIWTAADGFQRILLRDGLSSGDANAVNNRGQIVGSATVPLGKEKYVHALTGSARLGLDDPKPTRNGHSEAVALNNLGHAGGYATPPSKGWWQQHAVLIDQHGRSTKLGTLATPREQDYSMVIALNDADEAVGYSTRRGMSLAFYWSRATGMLPLHADTPDPNDWSMAISINRHGQVVGNYGGLAADGHNWEADFYWDAEHGAVDLAALIDPADPLKAKTELTGGGARINDRGEIVADAWVNRKLTAVLLTPAP